MALLKDLMGGAGLGPTSTAAQDGAKLDAVSRAGYLFNTTIAGIEQADAVLLIGTNPRWEAPIINARLRKRYLAGGFKVAHCRAAERSDLQGRVSRRRPADARRYRWRQASLRGCPEERQEADADPGAGALARADGAAVHALARQIATSCGLVKDGWNGFNVLHTAASRVGGLDLGFVPGMGGRDVAGILAGAEKGEIEIVYLLGADEIDTAKLGKAFVIYQGHHGDAGAHRADVILPGAAYTEKNATYVNTEGRVQQTRLAVFPPGEAREDWKIMRALSEAVGHKLKVDTLAQAARGWPPSIRCSARSTA